MELRVQQKKSLGFSLPELMVVIAIIGILTAIAVPTYKDYVVRVKVTELITLAQSAKLAVTEALIIGVPRGQINNDKVGLEIIRDRNNITELSIANARITIVGNSTSLGLDADKTLRIDLKPEESNGILSWQCGTEPTEFRKYVPENCRNPIPS